MMTMIHGEMTARLPTDLNRKKMVQKETMNRKETMNHRKMMIHAMNHKDIIRRDMMIQKRR